MRASRILTVAGGVLFAAAAAALIWPLHATGVRGTALRPHYVAFGWASFASLPDQPSTNDLRAAGVPVPQDSVAERRHVAEGLAIAGAVLLGAGLLLRRRARPERGADTG